MYVFSEGEQPDYDPDYMFERQAERQLDERDEERLHETAWPDEEPAVSVPEPQWERVEDDFALDDGDDW
jgi:hypothetical protein